MLTTSAEARWLWFKYRSNNGIASAMKALSRLSRFIMEMSRRRVMRALGIYLVTLWLLAQGVADLFPAFGLPDWSVRAFVMLGFLGVPVVALLAWRYELTPQGLIPDTAITDDDSTLIDLPDCGAVEVSWTSHGGSKCSESFHSAFSIGRDSGNAVEIADKRVSRRHARLFTTRGEWWVEDLSSSNGTYLDGKRITRSKLLASSLLQLHPEGPTLELRLKDT